MRYSIYAVARKNDDMGPPASIDQLNSNSTYLVVQERVDGGKSVTVDEELRRVDLRLTYIT